MVDEVLVLRKLSELDEYYQQIRELKSTTVAEYSRNWKVQRIIERTLQMMIETCIDVAGHIIADQGFRVPKNYSDTFSVLHENSILDDRLHVSLKKMAQFRNIVVHHYDKIDAEIVIGILQRDINDFIAYKDAIISYLQKPNSL